MTVSSVFVKPVSGGVPREPSASSGGPWDRRIPPSTVSLGQIQTYARTLLARPPQRNRGRCATHDLPLEERFACNDGTATLLTDSPQGLAPMHTRDTVSLLEMAKRTRGSFRRDAASQRRVMAIDALLSPADADGATSRDASLWDHDDVSDPLQRLNAIKRHGSEIKGTPGVSDQALVPR